MLYACIMHPPGRSDKDKTPPAPLRGGNPKFQIPNRKM